ncbi:MAG: hypothetical protein HY815_11265 [Candidatus Riflebacteria bacterium]|nr:hypothetical protein [Candidatus Riflebacteria bacterium]
MGFNPLEFNAGLFGQFEKALAEFFDKRMRDPDFMQILSKSMGVSLDAKAQLDARIEELLKGMNLVTRKDMEALFVTLNGLETRIIDLEEKVEELSRAASRPGPAGPAEPARAPEGTARAGRSTAPARSAMKRKPAPGRSATNRRGKNVRRKR